jgi:hypothetical protein
LCVKNKYIVIIHVHYQFCALTSGRS